MGPDHNSVKKSDQMQRLSLSHTPDDIITKKLNH